jgi:hypothetical protein
VLLRAALGVLLAATALSAAVALGASGNGEARCGVERWAVKTLQDPEGRALDLSRVLKTTVPTLRRQAVVRGPGDSRGRGVESTVFVVRARLVEAKLEEDNDVHLVVRGLSSSGTMIAEFPLAPTCTPIATRGAKARMRNARKAFGAACGVPGSSTFTPLTGRATLRGVGCFDFLHGQTGVAPNGIELHPVLKFASTKCRVAS